MRPLWRTILELGGSLGLGLCLVSSIASHLSAIDGTWFEAGTMSLNVNATANAGDPVLRVATDGTPYLAWHEAIGGGTRREYVKHWSGSSWISDGASDGMADNQNCYPGNLELIDQKPQILLPSDPGTMTNLVWRSFNGSSWTSLGSYVQANVSSSYVPPIAAWGNTPIAAYVPATGSPRLYAMKWNGTSWENLGGVVMTQVFSQLLLCGMGTFNSQPYLAFATGSVYPLLSIKTCNGSAWADHYVQTLGGTPALIQEANVATDATGNSIYAAVVEESTPNTFIKVWHLLAGGAVAQIGSTLGNYGQHAVLTLDHGNKYVAWSTRMGASPSFKLLLRAAWYNGTDWEPLGGALNRDANYDAGKAAIALAGGKLFVAWEENASTGKQIYVKYFQFATPTLTPVVRYASAQDTVLIKPNVFRPKDQPSVQISVWVGTARQVELTVYTRAGNKVRRLTIPPSASPDRVEATWDGKNERGELVQAGIYLLVLETENGKVQKKIAVLR